MKMKLHKAVTVGQASAGNRGQIVVVFVVVDFQLNYCKYQNGRKNVLKMKDINHKI